jgi:hypothetical protein
MTHPLFRHVFKQGLHNNTWVYNTIPIRSNLNINYGENNYMILKHNYKMYLVI